MGGLFLIAPAAARGQRPKYHDLAEERLRKAMPEDTDATIW